MVAVIPTYRPDRDELLALVAALRHEDVPTLVADDASPCTSDPVLASLAHSHVPTVRHSRNAGIARSLNDGLRYASQSGSRWLLTVDQDSTVPDGYIAALLLAASLAEAALGVGTVGAVAAGTIDDDSGALGYPVTWRDGIATTEEVIQTGTLWSVDALVALGGFDERLGIDAVDAAACLALRSAGLHVTVAPEVSIGHRIGAGRQVRLLGRDVMVSGHPAERRTTIMRNRLSLFPAEFVQSPVHALRTLRRVTVQTALAVTVEDDRWAKAKASIRGMLPHRDR